MIAVIGPNRLNIHNAINVQRIGELKPNVRGKITEVYLFQDKNHPHYADTITIAFGLGGYRSLIQDYMERLDDHSYLYINIPKEELTFNLL